MLEETPKMSAQGRSMALWAGVLGAPAVWGLQLLIGYAVAHWVCVKQAHFIPHLVTLIALLLVVVATFLSWRDWKAAGSGSPDNPGGGPLSRTRFLGGLGMLVSIYSGIVILAQGIASFFYDGCWT